MRLSLLFSLIASACLAQTTTQILQIGSSPQPEPTLLLVTTTGQVLQIRIGPGLKLDFTGGTPTIHFDQASAQPIPVRLSGIVAARQTDGSYLIGSGAAPPSNLVIYRNGSRQKAVPGPKREADYAVDPANPRRIIPNSKFPWVADDDVLADFEI